MNHFGFSGYFCRVCVLRKQYHIIHFSAALTASKEYKYIKKVHIGIQWSRERDRERRERYCSSISVHEQ